MQETDWPSLTFEATHPLGLPSRRCAAFEALRTRRRAYDVTLVAFDLIEFQGDDFLSTASSGSRKSTRGTAGTHADSASRASYPSGSTRPEAGPSKVWLKSKNPLGEAVCRERDDGRKW